MAEYIEGKEPHGKHAKANSSVPAKPVVTAFAVILIIGMSFLGGVSYQKSKHSTSQTAQTQGPAEFPGGSQNGGRRGFGGQRPAIGEVSAVSADSISVSLQSGSDSTYTINSSTTVTNDGNNATVSDIKTGDQVLVITSSSDTKIATRIMLNPSFGGPPQASSDSTGSGSQTN